MDRKMKYASSRTPDTNERSQPLGGSPGRPPANHNTATGMVSRAADDVTARAAACRGFSDVFRSTFQVACKTAAPSTRARASGLTEPVYLPRTAGVVRRYDVARTA